MKLKLKKNDIYILNKSCADQSLPKEIKIVSTDENHVFVDIDDVTSTFIRNKDFVNYSKKTIARARVTMTIEDTIRMFLITKDSQDSKLSELCNIFQEWCDRNNLPQQSADELLRIETITENQQQYLTAFIKVWDDVQGIA